MKDIKLPEEFRLKLSENKKAFENFNNLPPSHKKEYLKYYEEAKKALTRKRRLEKIISDLNKI